MAGNYVVVAGKRAGFTMDIFSIAEWQNGTMNKRSWWGGRKGNWCLFVWTVCGGNLAEFGGKGDGPKKAVVQPVVVSPFAGSVADGEAAVGSEASCLHRRRVVDRV